MQRDVKIGLILGVLLVAAVAVIFFRRDDTDREKFAELLPAPDAIAGKAKNVFGSSGSDPYPVAPEYLEPGWQSPEPKTARTPTPARVRQEEPAVEVTGSDGTKSSRGAAAILHPPEFGPPKHDTRDQPERVTSLSKQTTTDVAIRSKSPHEYTIQEGDTLSSIAEQLLGDASLYRSLVRANPDVLADENHIGVGQKIHVPDVSKSGAPQPAAAPRSAPSHRSLDSDRVYQVQANDTLMQIARRFYGDVSMWRAIQEANRDQLSSPEDMRAGMVLRLP